MDAALRALERCCICDAYFPPRQSAKKRRAHMDACAHWRGLSANDAHDCLLRAAAHALRDERERQAVAAQDQTLFARYAHPATTPARIARLATLVGARPDACSVGEARALHAAAHASCDALLSRYCLTRAPSLSRPATDAQAQRMLAQLERHAARLAPPRRRYRRIRSPNPSTRKAVPTSDDDDPFFCSSAIRKDTVATSDDDTS